MNSDQTLREAQHILSLSDEDVSSFIRQQTAQRRMSHIMMSLNEVFLTSEQDQARSMAARAIGRLGFL